MYRPLTISPFGFVRDKVDGLEDYQGDQYIDDLFHRYMSKPSGQELKKLRLETITYISKLLEETKGLTNFINLNIESGRLNSNGVRFLVDTVRFIETGRRQVDIIAWYNVLKLAKEMNENTSRKIESVKILDEEKDLLFKWLSQPFGFHDIIWSLKLMFGTVDSSAF